VIEEMLEKKGKRPTIMAHQINCGARIDRNQIITALDVLENEYPYKIKKYSYNFSELNFIT
jgi:hypothetical protein